MNFAKHEMRGQGPRRGSPAQLGKKQGFTLVEMLIVIVIIGILAAALIPRLSSARGRANDVGIKTATSQIATALLTYQMDFGSFPNYPNGTLLSTISGNLTQGGLDKMPKNTATTTCSGAGAGTNTTSSGDYLYVSIDSNKHFVIMACPETAGGANRVIGGQAINSGTTMTNINDKTCASITKGTAGTQGPSCQYANESELRYIYAN